VKTSPIPIARFLSTAILGFLMCLNSAPVRAQEAPQASPPLPASKAETSTLRLPAPFSLEDGTPVRLRLTAELSSANATVGQTVDFQVVEAVKIRDLVVIPEGGIAWATVTEAQHKRHMGRGGKLNLTIDKVRLADGERAPLRAVRDAQGGSHVGAMTTAMVATGILFFPAAPLFLFMHGKDVTIPAGTEVTAYVNGDFTLDRTRFLSPDAAPAGGTVAQSQPSAAATPPPIAQDQPPPSATPTATAQSQEPVSVATPAAAPAQSQEAAQVEVQSKPPGADILLDGKFVGNTPSTLRFAAGDHTVRIEKAGYKPWEKAFTVLAGGQLTLNATLEPQ